MLESRGLKRKEKGEGPRLSVGGMERRRKRIFEEKR